jgi:hypothetical protein
MASRMQAFEANQRSLLLQSQTAHLLSQTRDAGTLLNVINQQRLNDIATRIARLECEHSSRPNPT